METKYHLENIETKSILGEYTVHLCNYIIYNNQYILYLLELIEKQYYFPHFISKGNVLEESTQYINKLKLNGNIKGYYILNNECYIMINLHMDISIQSITPYVFSSIYEIIFMRSCLGEKIHNSIIYLFIQHPYLLYLYDNTRKAIPEMGYYITSTSRLYYNAYIGLDPNEDGNIILHNNESVPNKPYIRILSTLKNYKIKSRSTTKSRIIVIDNYMVVSYHKN